MNQNRNVAKKTDELRDSKTNELEKKGNPKKKGFHPKRKGKVTGDTGKYRKGMFNDVTYYSKNPEITKAFCKLPFSFIVGSKIPNLEDGALDVSAIVSYIVDWLPSSYCKSQNIIGSSPSIMDQAKSIIYTAMRRANSGSTNNIEPVDVFTSNLLASIDILCNAVNCSRVFRIANSFSWKNRIIPREIFRHLGINYDDFVANQANYRGRYDTLVAFAKTIRTLSNFPFIQAALAEYENIFKDEDTDTGREQLIVPVKAFHHIYDPVGTSDHPGGTVRLMTEHDVDSTAAPDNLVYTAGNGTWPGYHFSYWLDVMETQISALVNDADFNLIQADLEKAFGEQGNYIETDKVSSDIEPINIKYSSEFMEMFHNGTFLPTPGSESSAANARVVKRNEYCNTIYQIPASSGVNGTQFGFQIHVVYPNKDVDFNQEMNKYIGIRSNNSNTGAILDTNENDPNEEHIIIMTRYKYAAEAKVTSAVLPDFRVAQSGTHTYFQAKASSNFIVFGNEISHIHYAAGSATATVISYDWDTLPSLLTGALSAGQALVLQVNHGPMVFFKASSSTYIPMFELNNIRYVNNSELSNINDSCFLSLWDVPSRTNI